MHYSSHYDSPLGQILLAEDGAGLIGLWFAGQKYFAQGLPENPEEKETPLLAETKRWLTIYFSGRNPEYSIPLHFIGTSFQVKVWNVLRSIPYGKTATYGEIAEQISGSGQTASFLARAVGNAVGHNPISILVPCHRVIGKNGRLVGYAGGLERKRKLLDLEKFQL